MNDDKKAKRKDWVKNIAIIFLLIMLLLTLFSNTIKNYSLPIVTMINPSQTTIKEQARGTGTIEAGEKYTVKATESRIVSSVAIKKGDHVEKGDVLYYLEDKDSEELKKAEEELKKLETDYLTSLFDGNASDETIIKVKSGNFESLGSYQARLAKINSEIEEKKNEKEEYNNYITGLKITKTYEDSLRNTYSIDNIIAAITYQKEIAGYENTSDKTAFENEKNAISNDLALEISNFNYYVNNFDDLKISDDDPRVKASDGNYYTLQELNKHVHELQNYKTTVDGRTYIENSSIKELAEALSYQTYIQTLEKNKNAQEEKIEQANIDAYTTLVTTIDTEITKLEAERTKLISDIAAEIKLEKYTDDIEKKKQEVEELKAASMGATVLAPVAGIVDTLTYVAGESTEKDKEAASIIMDGKGYALSITVDLKQAQRVKVGDMGEPTNYWAFDGVSFTVKSIKDDPDSKGKQKIIEFNVEGENVSIGQSVTINVGTKSQVYDLVVPNAAVRKSNEGSFVLILTVKKTPFGERYIATKIPVTEKASDDTNTAIAGDLTQGDYVIVSATKPLADGEEFRIKEG